MSQPALMAKEIKEPISVKAGVTNPDLNDDRITKAGVVNNKEEDKDEDATVSAIPQTAYLVSSSGPVNLVVFLVLL
jgi:hypothetical protein